MISPALKRAPRRRRGQRRIPRPEDDHIGTGFLGHRRNLLGWRTAYAPLLPASVKRRAGDQRHGAMPIKDVIPGKAGTDVCRGSRPSPGRRSVEQRLAPAGGQIGERG
jgi:hypothetical protein